MKYLIPAVLLPLLLSACGPDYLYEKEYQIAEEGWSYEDTLNFTVTIPDTLSLYNLYLEINHSTDYDYQNLYTRFHTGFPSGERPQKVVSLELANRAGVWLGDCNRRECTLLIPVQTNAYFNQTGEHTFTIEQYMRQSPITGIRKIGFMIEDSGKKRE